MAGIFRAALILCLLSAPAYAQELGWQTHDGDTTRASFRIANVDAPEVGNDAKCDAERNLGIRAREFTKAWLVKGRVVIRQDLERPFDSKNPKRARVLATFERDGEDLGEALIKAGLSRPYVRGQPIKWCDLLSK